MKLYIKKTLITINYTSLQDFLASTKSLVFKSIFHLQMLLIN